MLEGLNEVSRLSWSWEGFPEACPASGRSSSHGMLQNPSGQRDGLGKMRFGGDQGRKGRAQHQIPRASRGAWKDGIFGIKAVKASSDSQCHFPHYIPALAAKDNWDFWAHRGSQ